MPVSDIKRPNYYEGQYLDAADLMAAQEYQRQQDQRHRLAAHTWGIAVGLELEERPMPGGGDAVDLYLKPGYAVDGFGRTIVILEPYKVPEALFAQFTFDPAFPDGLWIPVWLRYREQTMTPPQSGYSVCNVTDQAYRILETFRVVVGGLPSIAQERDQISVAGKMEDAASEKLPDTSIPYQALPDIGDGSRWLIRLGSARWLSPNPPATTVGHFVKSDADADKQRAREGRPYLGVVAESLLAPAGKVRIRDRSKATILANETGDLVAIEGSLRVDDNLYIRGKVGIGTLAPEQSLSVKGALNIDQSNSNAGSVSPGITFGSGSGEGMASKRTGGGNGFGLDFYTASLARLSITQGGNVGIATTAPTHKLHVNDNSGIRQNRLYLSGGDGWSSLSYNAYHKPDNKDWVFPDSARPAVTIEMDDSGDNPRFQVFSTTKGARTTWLQRLAIDGDSGNVAMAHNGGRVGIGTTNPSRKLEVVGDVQVTNGNIFVGNTMIPIHAPVDVVVGNRTLITPPMVGKAGGFNPGTDVITVTSRLLNVSKATVMVALSDISNFAAAVFPRWSVQVRNVNLFNNPPPGGSGAIINVDWRVDDDGEIVCYQFVVVFEP